MHVGQRAVVNCPRSGSGFLCLYLHTRLFFSYHTYFLILSIVISNNTSTNTRKISVYQQTVGALYNFPVHHHRINRVDFNDTNPSYTAIF